MKTSAHPVITTMVLWQLFVAHDVLAIHKISYYLYISYILSDYIILSIPLLYYRLYIFYIYLYIYIYIKQ